MNLDFQYTSTNNINAITLESKKETSWYSDPLIKVYFFKNDGKYIGFFDVAHNKKFTNFQQHDNFNSCNLNTIYEANKLVITCLMGGALTSKNAKAFVLFANNELMVGQQSLF